MYPVELIIHRISSHTRGENPDYSGRIYFLVYRWMGYNLREGGSLQGAGKLISGRLRLIPFREINLLFSLDFCGNYRGHSCKVEPR